jgi:hypothetical protein
MLKRGAADHASMHTTRIDGGHGGNRYACSAPKPPPLHASAGPDGRCRRRSACAYKLRGAQRLYSGQQHRSAFSRIHPSLLAPERTSGTIQRRFEVPPRAPRRRGGGKRQGGVHTYRSVRSYISTPHCGSPAAPRACPPVRVCEAHKRQRLERTAPPFWREFGRALFRHGATAAGAATGPTSQCSRRARRAPPQHGLRSAQGAGNGGVQAGESDIAAQPSTCPLR